MNPIVDAQLMSNFMLAILDKDGIYVPSKEMLEICNSHEELRKLVKDLLAEIMSKDNDNSRDLIERARHVALEREVL